MTIERDPPAERRVDRTAALAEVERLARHHGCRASCLLQPSDLMDARRAAFLFGCSSQEVRDAAVRGWSQAAGLPPEDNP